MAESPAEEGAGEVPHWAECDSRVRCNTVGFVYDFAVL